MKTFSDKNVIQVTKKSVSRIIVQIFVWLLVIAFISTIGVMWDGQANSLPLIVTSSNDYVDLSPNGLFMMEYDRIDNELKDRKNSISPKLYTKYIQARALTNTADNFARKIFYKDVNIFPSLKTFQYYQNNSGLSSNMIDYQYSELYANGPIGIFSLLSTPTVSDIYAINDLKNLSIATELLVFSKTNFLFTKVTDADKESYYASNFIQWLDSIVVQEFKVKNRGQARKLITFIKENGIDQTILSLDNVESMQGISYTKDRLLTDDSTTYSYFVNVLKEYKDKKQTNSSVTSDPIYFNGEYYIVVINNIKSFGELLQEQQVQLTGQYVLQNYNKLAKIHNKEWNDSLKKLKEKILSNESYSQISQEIVGAIAHTTQPLTLVDPTISTVLGGELNIPVMNNKPALDAILNTPIGQSSDIIFSKTFNDIYLAVRPLDRQYKETTVPNIQNNQPLFQEISRYKNRQILNNFSYNGLRYRYNIELYPNTLSNLNIEY